jgi:ABC-type oligopeptide transport system substrate-binding subunit
MKKSVFLIGLLATASLCLTACGNSKDYTMTFDEAYDVANHSALQDMLISSENFQQELNLSTNIDN